MKNIYFMCNNYEKNQKFENKAKHVMTFTIIMLKVLHLQDY